MATSSERRNASADPPGLGVVRSIPYFAVPAVAMAVSIHWVLPRLQGMGLSEYAAYLVAVGGPLTGLLVAALVALRRHDPSITRPDPVAFFRLRALRRADWTWIALTVLVAGPVGLLVAEHVTVPLVNSGWIPLPPGLPAFLDPTTEDPATALEEATGGLEGNWSLIAAVILVHVVNIAGEELWWRGVVLPRQEVALGRSAWWIHGAMWTLFHAYKYWDLLTLLPLCLAISYVAQRRRSTTPGLVSHFVTNGTGLVALIAIAAGAG